MITYKQWHDDDSKFHDEKIIYFSQCDARHNLTLAELLKMTSDTAVEDFRQRGMSWDFLIDKGYLILVSRLAFRFHKIPKANDKITISTWEEKPSPLFFNRIYELTDSETGENLITGYSTWTLVDFNARKILRTKDFTLRQEPTISAEHDCMMPGKISAPENLVLLKERPIWYSDIDGNGHTNNSRYGAFVVDALPPEFQEKIFKDFRMNFSKEAVLGQMIQIYGKFDDEAKKITIIGKQEENICFESELYY